MSRFALFFLVLVSAAHAEVRYEAYSTIEIGGKPAGFSLQRHEYDPRTRKHLISYYLHTKTKDGDIDQFVSTEQSANYQPLKVTVRTKGHGDERSAVVKDGKLVFDDNAIALPPQAFFSSALMSVLMTKRPTKGQAYAYEAFSEESEKLGKGEVLIVDETTVGKTKIFRTATRFENVEYESWVTDAGFTLATSLLYSDLKTRVVANGRATMQTIRFPSQELAKYFGKVPSGGKNPVSEKRISLKEPLFKTKLDLSPFEGKTRIPLTLSK